MASASAAACAVGEPAGQPEQARPVGAQPDADRVRGNGSGPRPAELVVLAGDGHRRARRPQGAEHGNRLGQRIDGRPGITPGTTHGRHAVGEGAGAPPQFEPAAAEDVQAGGGTGQHRRRAQRQVDHVGDEPEAGGLGGQGRQQRPHVEEARLVGVVLHAQHVQATLDDDQYDLLVAWTAQDGSALACGIEPLPA